MAVSRETCLGVTPTPGRGGGGVGVVPAPLHPRRGATRMDMQRRLLFPLPLLLLIACTGEKSDDSSDSQTDSQEDSEATDDSQVTDDSAKDSEDSPDDTAPPDDSIPTDDTAPAGPLEIQGRWFDDYGTAHEINQDAWQMGNSRFLVSSWDNDADYLIAQNDSINAYFPGLWSRFDWTMSGSTLYYCQIAYDAADASAAEAANGADFTDLIAGCNGFAWSRLRPQLEIRGSWVDNWGSSHTISEDLWAIDSSSFHISQYDNFSHYAIAQNDATNAWYPAFWSRFDWTWNGSSYYYCQTAYDAATEADALATAAANSSDLLTGCGGFSWSKLSAPLAIIGSYTDNYGSSHDIAQDSWTMGNSVFHIELVDNNGNFLVAQNDAANSYNPELYSRFDWTFDQGTLYYCQIAYDAADLGTALQNTTAARADLAAGCNGFAWTTLTPQ